MKGIFLCKTPYQILVAVRIATTIYKEDSLDIIVFDSITNYQKLSRQIQKSRVFKEVLTFEGKQYDSLRRIKKRVFPLFFRADIPGNTVYDYIFLGNISDWVENAIVKLLKKRNPKKAHLFMFEDGFSTYSKRYEECMKNLKPKNWLLRKYYHYILCEYFSIEKLYVFSPELLDWKPEMIVEPVRRISLKDLDYIQCVNEIFDYINIEDHYEEPVIFFEESYYANGIDVGDEKVADLLAQAVGKQELMVKIHPRNPDNRFKKEGFKTNVNTEVPWEVIALNIDISKKILVTIASGSALTSLVNMTSCPKKIIMLMNCKEISDSKLTPTLGVLRKVACTYPEQVYIPGSLEEFLPYMKGRQYENSSSNAN